MRYLSLLLAVLFFQLEVCVAFPWSKDGLFHWLLERQLNNVIAHTESSIGLADLFTGVPSLPSQGPGGKAQPGVAHTEDQPAPLLTTAAGGFGGQTVQTAHEEQHPASATTTPTPETHAPYVEATITPAPAQPSAHTENPPLPPKNSNPQPGPGQSGSGPSSGSSGASNPPPPPPSSGPSGENSQPNPQGEEESSSGSGSPDLGAPGYSAPAPAQQISSTPVAEPGTQGSFSLGSTTYSYSAIPGQGANGISAVVVGSQTATPGQTLTINSQEVVVSASGSSLYFAPVVTVVPSPAASSVTRVWTEGGKTVTGVFAAPTGSQAQGDSEASTPSQASIQQAKATAESQNSSNSTTSARSTTSGLTTSATPSSSGGSSTTGSAAPSHTGAASRLASTLSSGLIFTAASFMLARWL